MKETLLILSVADALQFPDQLIKFIEIPGYTDMAELQKEFLKMKDVLSYIKLYSGFLHHFASAFCTVTMNSNTKKTASFKIEFPGGADIKSAIQQKFAAVKEKMRREAQSPLNNSQVFLKLLDHWLDQAQSAEPEQAVIMRTSYLPAARETTKEKIFMTTKSSLQKCMDLASDHARTCKGQLQATSLIRKGHVALTRMRCQHNHATKWSSSPYLPNGQYLVNHRMFHGFSCSGQLPSHYERMCEASNIGVIDWRSRTTMLTK